MLKVCKSRLKPIESTISRTTINFIKMATNHSQTKRPEVVIKVLQKIDLKTKPIAFLIQFTVQQPASAQEGEYLSIS